jgi:spore maturation protein CgeB
VKIVFFVHAIASCWNNGNAHFLRGIGAELQRRGHDVVFCEPEGSWSETNLVSDHGAGPLEEFRRAFPLLKITKYRPEALDLDRLTDDVSLVIVHEWNDPSLVNALGRKRRGGARFRLLFHDTHHRALTQPDSMGRYQLGDYDGVLAFGGILADLYRKRMAAHRVWTWHEAADTALFYPRITNRTDGDLVWVGNWGDDERTAELDEFVLRPVGALGLSANFYGVRYPETAVRALAERGVAYNGWLPNHHVHQIFARHRLTVHVPRRPYAEALRGIPTIRVFEALACGIPLISAPWDDAEQLFSKDCFLMARNGEEMKNHLRDVLSDPALAQTLRDNGLKIIRERHTCRHRVDELLDSYSAIAPADAATKATEAA